MVSSRNLFSGKVSGGGHAQERFHPAGIDRTFRQRDPRRNAPRGQHVPAAPGTFTSFELSETSQPLQQYPPSADRISGPDQGHGLAKPALAVSERLGRA